MKTGRLVLGVICLLWTTFTVAAANLTAELNPLVAKPRVGAPEWVEIKLTSRSVTAREGTLEIDGRTGQELLYRYRTHEIAFVGAQKFRFLIPCTQQSEYSAARSWSLRFIEHGTAIPLGEFEAPPSVSDTPNLVFATTRPEAAERTNPPWQALRVERSEYFAKENTSRLTVTTTPVFLSPDEWPADPLGYCAFDAVLLDGTAFAALRERQLNALARWVEGGGALCIIANQAIGSTQLQFLNGLASVDPKVRAFTLMPDDRLSPPLAGQSLQVHATFGRLLVCTTPLTAETAEAQSAASFLWSASASPPRPDPQADFEDRLQWQRRTVGSFRTSSLTEALMPKNVRMLPLSLLAGMFLGFLLVVGPIEYWLFGKLRRRWLTWISFPCASLTLTWLTVRTAERYMGSQTNASALIISDIGPRGEIVRETRLQLSLPARNQQAETKVQQALFSNMSQFSMNGRYQWPRQQAMFNPYNSGLMATNPSSRSTESGAFPTIEGQFPARYVVRQTLQQWKPQLDRTLSLNPAKDTSGIPWERLTPKFSEARTDRQVFPIFDGIADLIDIFPGQTTLNENSLGRLLPRQLRALLTQPFEQQNAARFLARSPTGASSLNDIVCYDLDEKQAIVAAVTRREGNDFHMWRRLFLR